MGVYLITGGRPLEGVITIHGAKNSVLPILAAALSAGGEYTIENCPDISDVYSALRILEALGCKTRREGNRVTVDTTTADKQTIPEELMRTMRAAVIFLGALLTRFGEAELSQPGGCCLGERPIDLHLRGLEQMGVRCVCEGERLFCKAERLRGSTIALSFPSVGATENLLLAALGCPGETVICNAAREPEITDLIGFLRACGGEISGAGTSVLRVQGGKRLHGCTYRVMPDRMEAATYLSAAALTGGDITLKSVCPPHLEAVIHILRQSGCEIQENRTELRLRGKSLRGVSPIITAPYPAFPTDAQATVMAVMAVAQGVSIFEETIFSDRFRHVPGFCAMGAKIQATRRHAVVEGVKRLHGAEVEATDLRGGAALTVAALGAEGDSRITRVEHIERGYASFVETLQSCGGQISKKEGQ